MFPFAFVFVVYARAPHQTIGRKDAALRAALSLIVFLTFAAPFVILLSRSKNRFSIRDSARLNYAWHGTERPALFISRSSQSAAGTRLHATRI